MSGLLKNEWIKSWKQTGYRVCLIILAVLLFVMPIGSWVIDKMFSINTWALADMKERYLAWSEECNGDGDMLDAEYYAGMADACDFYIQNDLNEDSWRYSDYYSDYSQLCISVRLYRAVVDGVLEPDALLRYEDYSDYDGFTHYTYLPDSAVDEYGRIRPDFDFVSALAILQNEKDKTEQLILTSNSLVVIAAQVERWQETVESYENTVSCLEVMLFESPDDAEISYQLDSAKRSLEAYKEVKKGFDWLYSHKVDRDDWRYTVVSDLLVGAMNQYAGCVAEPRELYEKNNWSAVSYSTYLRSLEDQEKAAKDAAATAWYSLEHDVPVPGADGTSVKSALLDYISMAGSWITIFLIVMSVLIVSGEFTSGTVRLLVIRPKKRTKIILSKLLCILFWGIGMVAGSAIVLLPLTIATKGVGDLFAPQLFVFGEHIVQIHAVPYLLGYVLMMLIQSLLFASIAFLLTTLIRKSALPIVLSILLTTVSGGVQSLILTVQYFFSFRAFDYTILANFNLSGRLMTSAEAILQGSFYEYLVSASRNIFVSVAVVVVHIALFVYLSVLSFRLREIKN